MQADAADFPAEVTQAADLALESKGHGVLILDLRGISTATDYFVLASGTSDVQVKAIAEHVVDELKKENVRPARRSLGVAGLHRLRGPRIPSAVTRLLPAGESLGGRPPVGA